MLLVIILSGWLISLAAMLVMMRHAPEGYEDEQGYHDGTPPRQTCKPKL